MPKFFIILGIVVGFALFSAMVWPFETHLSEADIQRITAVVREQTAEPILSIRPLPRWRVHVETGATKGPLSGGGHAFYFSRSFGGWRIYRDYLWVG